MAEIYRVLSALCLPSPESFPGATGGRGHAVDAPAATCLQRVAQVVDPVRRNGERPEPVVFNTILDLALLTRGCATPAFRIGQHRLQQMTFIGFSDPCLCESYA